MVVFIQYLMHVCKLKGSALVQAWWGLCLLTKSNRNLLALIMDSRDTLIEQSVLKCKKYFTHFLNENAANSLGKGSAIGNMICTQSGSIY